MDPEARPLPSSIPSAHRTLVACVRDALRNCPPPAGAAEPAWSQLDRAAREQGVDAFLFPWLAAHYPARFGASAARPDSVPGAWRARVLSDLPRVALRQRQLADLAAGFARAGLDLIMLKGAWLAETAYADPALRSMSDIDVLVRSDQRDLGHAAMLELGYAASADTLHSRFAYDQLYRHPLHPYSVEMHWAVSSEQEADSPEADMAAVWQHAVSARLFGHPLRALSVSDQLAHLAHHMLHHQFAVPLRAYLDVALLVRAQGDTLSPEAIEAAGARWQTGSAIPFILRFTSELLDIPLPSALADDAPPLEAPWRDAALHALAHLPAAAQRGGESTWLSYRQAGLAGRARLVLSRIFMPRAFLAERYPCARTLAGLPRAWICRARDLRRTHWTTIAALNTDASPEQQRLDTAAVRRALARHLR
jgi:hypothetical protein